MMEKTSRASSQEALSSYTLTAIGVIIGLFAFLVVSLFIMFQILMCQNSDRFDTLMKNSSERFEALENRLFPVCI